MGSEKVASETMAFVCAIQNSYIKLLHCYTPIQIKNEPNYSKIAEVIVDNDQILSAMRDSHLEPAEIIDRLRNNCCPAVYDLLDRYERFLDDINRVK